MIFNSHFCKMVLGLTLLILPLIQCSQKGGETGREGKAPNFVLKDLNGQPHSLNDFLGKVVLVNFWATWCGPCQIEMPHLNELYKKYSGQGFELIAVAIGDEEAYVKPFVERTRYPFKFLIGTEAVARDYEIQGIPVVILVDKKGVVVERHVGFSMEHIRSLESHLKDLL